MKIIFYLFLKNIYFFKFFYQIIYLFFILKIFSYQNIYLFIYLNLYGNCKDKPMNISMSLT